MPWILLLLGLAVATPARELDPATKTLRSGGSRRIDFANSRGAPSLTQALQLALGGTVGARSPYMLMPSVDRYMTREPYAVASTDNLEHARSLMRTHLIRHLPVLEGDQLVGVLSDRDIAVIEAVPGIDLAHVEIARVMAPPVYTWGETPLDEVSELMNQRKADCVVVRGGQGIKGIFTATDALQALAELVRRATA